MRYLLGIDLGTSSVRSMLMDESGVQVALAQREYDFEIPHPDWAEQDPDTWWSATVETIGEVLAGIDPAKIGCIGFSGQMHGFVPLGKDGRPVRNAIIWCDKRTASQVNETYAKIGRDRMLKIAHSPVGTGFLVPSLLWMQEHEKQAFGQISCLLMPKDYIRFRLTGERATDITDASATLAFDVTRGEWSPEVLQTLGFPRAIFPPVGFPTDLAGTVCKASAEETGLKAGTKTVLGGADQVMQAIGNGIVEPGTLSVTIGTGGQVFSPLSAPLYDRTGVSHAFNFYRPRSWYFLGATLSGGLSLKWARSLFGKTESFKEIDELAAKVPPGSERLLFLPYLYGERTPHMDSNARGIFFGTAVNHTRANFYRSVMEGVAFSMNDCISVFTENLGMSFGHLVASGGAAKSPLWLQIQANVYDHPITKSRMKEQACVGAAIVAGVGCGSYRSVGQGCESVVEWDPDPVLPQPELVAIYRQYYGVYRQLYAANRMLLSKLDGLHVAK